MKKVLFISFALLTLILSFNPGVAFHFCGGELAQAKLLGYGNADCSMENNRPNCKKHAPAKENHPSSEINKIPCCANEFQIITTDNYQPPLKILVDNTVELIPLLQNELWFFENCVQLISIPFYRPPPNLTTVFLPFIQSFII